MQVWDVTGRTISQVKEAWSSPTTLFSFISLMLKLLITPLPTSWWLHTMDDHLHVACDQDQNLTKWLISRKAVWLSFCDGSGSTYKNNTHLVTNAFTQCDNWMHVQPSNYVVVGMNIFFCTSTYNSWKLKACMCVSILPPSMHINNEATTSLLKHGCQAFLFHIPPKPTTWAHVTFCTYSDKSAWWRHFLLRREQ